MYHIKVILDKDKDDIFLVQSTKDYAWASETYERCKKEYPNKLVLLTEEKVLKQEGGK